MNPVESHATRLQDELRLYEQTFAAERLNGKHLAPHALEMAATWAVLTRIWPMRTGVLSPRQTLRLYDGRVLPGMRSNEAERMLAAELEAMKGGAAREGTFGISSQFVQDCIADALAANAAAACVGVLVVLHQMELGLQHHPPARRPADVHLYRVLLRWVVEEELGAIVKQEAKQAVAGDEGAMQRLCAAWLKAWRQGEMIRNHCTGIWEHPDELMGSILRKMHLPLYAFRSEVTMYMGALAQGKKFDDGSRECLQEGHEQKLFEDAGGTVSRERLQEALEQKLFEDAGGTVTLASLVSNAPDPAIQENLATVRSRLMQRHGYCEVCAMDMLKYAASIFAGEQ
jgi:serine protein kinase